MIDFDKPVTPDDGTVRLVDNFGSPSSDG